MSIMGILTTHSPRLIKGKDILPVFQPMVDGMNQCGEDMANFRPDAIVVLSTHWFTTFNIYADGTPGHSGVYTAAEAPETINRLTYSLKGDPDLAELIVEGGKKVGLPCYNINEGSLEVDYGTLVPVSYFDPKSRIPVIPMSVCMNSSIGQYIELGRSLARTFKSSGKRVAFVVSGSLSHWHTRNPADWPKQEYQDMDRELLEYLDKLEWDRLAERLGPISEATRMEGYGYHIAALVGLLQEVESDNLVSKLYIYGPSSGTGNAIMSFMPHEVA